MNVKAAIEALPAMPSLGNDGRSEERRKAALRPRVALLNSLQESPMKVWSDHDSEIQHVIDEVEELESREPMSHPGHVHPGGFLGKAQRSGGSRWKAGHWGDPVVRELGSKALLSGSITVPSLTGGIVPIAPGDRATSMVDVAPSTILRGTDTFRYLQETARTNNAAEVAASGLKPTSVYTVQKVDDTVRTIAHLSQPINRFDLEDTDLLRGYIDGSLRAGVLLRLDSQILSGNGTPPNLRGLANVAGIQTQAFSGNLLTTARKALTKLQVNAERYSGVYVVSPGIWEAIELLQEADGSYLMSGDDGPVDLMRQRLWGQPVIVTNAITGATPSCYLFDPADTHLWERDRVQVDWSEAPVGSVADHAAFESNEIVFRGEGRFGFAVLRPASVVQWATA